MIPGDLLSTASVAKKLTELLARPLTGHQVKEVMRSLLPLGIDVTGLTMDTSVTAYLLDASSGGAGSPIRGGGGGRVPRRVANCGSAWGTSAVKSVGRSGLESSRPGQRAWRTRPVMWVEIAESYKRIVANDMGNLLDTIRATLHSCPGQNGSGRHRDRPGRAAGHCRQPQVVGGYVERRSDAVGQAWRLQREFDPATADGPLRRNLGLTPDKKTKTGYSTDAQTLESLREAHPIIPALLAYARSGEAALDLRREPAGRGGS